MTPSQSKLNLSLDYRLISVVLLAIILALLFLWKPWSGSATGNRTVDVTGESTLSARPDEFVFYPAYEAKNADKTAAIAELTQKSNEIVAKLKSLGVDDGKIKTSTSGYDYPARSEGESTPTYTLQMTVTVGKDDLAQKVQDYLVTTAPTGSVSPQASFSEATRKKLESQARDKATKDARAKADQMGENLGFKIGKVKSVQDGAGFSGGPITLEARGSTMMTEDSKASLAVQPGENDLTYTVTVVYYIK